MEHTILGGSGTQGLDFYPLQTNGVVSWDSRKFIWNSILRFIDKELFLWETIKHFVGLQRCAGRSKWNKLYFPFLFSAHPDKKSEGFYTVSWISANGKLPSCKLPESLWNEANNEKKNSQQITLMTAKI